MATPRTPLAPLVALGIAAALLVLAATSTYGIGVSAESETYIAAARNFASGRGLSVPAASGALAPLTEHAPLYAFVLGIAERGGADAVAAARWLAALCFGGLVLAAGLGLRSLSKRPWLPVMAAALVACSVVTLNMFLMALSESLFLVATVGALLLLARYLQSGDTRLLAAAAACSALALLTRYAGVAVVAAGAAAILRYARPPRRKAAFSVFVFASCLPLMAWSVYTALRTGNPVHREFAFHPVSSADAFAAVRTISTWLLPAVVPLPVRLLALALVSLWMVEVLRRGRAGIPCRLLLAFAAAYLLVIAAAKSLLDSAIPMDDRILSPLFVPLLLAAALGLDRAASVLRRRWTVAAPGVIVVLIAGGLNLARISPCVAAMRNQGREYTGVRFRQSTLARWLGSLDPSAPVYSNADSAIRFLRPGAGGGLPAKADLRSGRPNPFYPDDLDRLRAGLADGRGAIVYFTDSPISDRFLPSLPELTRALRLGVVAQGDNWVALRPAVETAER